MTQKMFQWNAFTFVVTIICLPSLIFAFQSGSPGGKNALLEEELLTAISPNKLNDGRSRRIDNSPQIQSLVSRLEECESIPRPAIDERILGRWKLLHTTNADTASPIQRSAVDASQFQIFQDILLRKKDDDVPQLVVSQVVKFGNKSELRVDALASTSKYPLPELSNRKRTGKIFGINLLGVSKVGTDALENSDKPDSRIDFVFDEGNFQFGDFPRIPYPVPFRNPLFRDAVKGWIDITYLSQTMRISRGNKGTTFILVNEKAEGD